MITGQKQQNCAAPGTIDPSLVTGPAGMTQQAIPSMTDVEKVALREAVERVRRDLEDTPRGDMAVIEPADLRTILSALTPSKSMAPVEEALRAQGVALAAFVNLLRPVMVQLDNGKHAMTNQSRWERNPTPDEVQAALKAQNDAAAALASLQTTGSESDV